MSSQPTDSLLSYHIPSSSVMSASSQSSVLQSLLKDAVEKYKNQVGKSLIEDQLAITLRTCDSVESVAALLEERAQAFREFLGQDRHGKITKSIKRVVHVFHTIFNPVSGAIQVGHGMASIPFPPVKIIFAAIGILLATVKDVIGSYDALLGLFESLGNAVQRLDIHTKMPPSSVMTNIIGKIIVELLSTLALATKEIKRGRLKKFGMKLFGENEVEAAVKRLDGLIQHEALAIGAETLHQIRSDANEAKRKDIQTWLDPPDPLENHNLAREAFHRSPATWFVQGAAFTEWKSSGSLLWIHGIPGAGKSILCSTIIEDINSMRESEPASLAFFYCDFRDKKKQDRRWLLSSLLDQLCDQSDSYYEILYNAYSKNGRSLQDPSDGSLTQCLKDLVKCPGQAPIYIIIDGLDECPNATGTPSPRRKVLMLVEELVGLQLSNLHICITSRLVADIETVLDPLKFRSVSLHDEGGQKQEILNYVASVVNSDPEMQKWRTEDKELVIRTLSERSQGMFKLVFCQFDVLRRCHPRRIRHALNDLPRTLDGTYERTLQDISEAIWEDAYVFFQFIMVASRPLRVEELAEVLAFDFDAEPVPTLVERWRQNNPEETVLSTCSSLIMIVEIEGFRVVQFSHLSVKEFLMSGHLATQTYTLSRYHIPLTLAHTIVGRACLGVLVQLDEDVSMDSLENFPLAKYAAVHWVDHTQFENVSLDTKILFDPRKPHFSVWTRMLELETYWWSWWSQGKGTPLQYAAQFGLRDVAEFLVVERLQDVNYRSTSDNSTPLLIAAKSGHYEVARILLQRGADANARNHESWTPLHFASHYGQVEVAQVLLKGGADANAQNDKRWTPLHFASQDGTVEVVQVLLKGGADASARNDDSRTPLHIASYMGHVEVVQILLEGGADASAKNDDSRTPLHVASWEGHVKAVQVLLEGGADPSAQNKFGRTPLHFTSGQGNVEMVQVLLKGRADPSARADDSSTPLHVASQKGHVEVVQDLLKHGADPSAQDDDKSTPLHFASQKGHAEVVQVLLKHGTDPSAQDNDSSTPLHFASQNGHVEVVEALLERGTDASAQNKYSRAPLHLASYLGHVEVVQVLLGRGADASAQDDDSSTPLHAASKSGYVEVVQVLLEGGADPSAQNKYGWTPLHFASQKGHAEVVRVLLKRDADPSARDYDSSTPLHPASQKGHVEVVQVLLEGGADPSARDDESSTPLHVASQEGHVEVVQVLLERGADTSAQNYNSMTPLHLASRRGHVKVVQVLLEGGADASAHNKLSWTPLHFASYLGRVEVVRELLEHGADVNSQNEHSSTPLHFASQEGHVEIVQVLLNGGADPSAQNEYSRTPLRFASEEGYVEVVQVLLEGGADPSAGDEDRWTPLHFASKKGYVEVVQVLLKGCADPNAQNKRSETPLHLALQNGHVEVAQVLLWGGADVDARDDDGWAPLHFASQGHVEVVQVLLKGGADPSAQNKESWAPLHVASEDGHVEVVQVLLGGGADPSARGKHNWTPLHLASQQGHVEVVQVLLERGADVNARDKDNCTPFQLALKQRHYSLTEVLLAHEAKEENHVSAAAEC